MSAVSSIPLGMPMSRRRRRYRLGGRRNAVIVRRLRREFRFGGRPLERCRRAIAAGA
jgi:hypothetical protein